VLQSQLRDGRLGYANSPISGLWRLKRCGASWRLVNGHKSLVSPVSNTSATISKILSPLELQSHIHVLFDGSSVVFIELHRRRLDFCYAPGESKIHSHQYQEMIIDTDQRIGTLSGVEYSTTMTGHVSVSIELDTAWTTHAYQVDEVLGRLIENGSLQSKLFFCYLHALTAHCLPDGHTGTEAALSILRLGAVSSFDVLTASNTDILKRIAHLMPGRESCSESKGTKDCHSCPRTPVFI
jgi:hypothetical protein